MIDQEMWTGSIGIGLLRFLRRPTLRTSASISFSELNDALVPELIETILLRVG
jgi:hypothetical protein